ncbi:hypothetical protein D3C71_1940760 [compost metagenome]
MLSVEEAKSGRLTKNEPILSASFNGIPFKVTLIRALSEPRIFILVYPIPAPASEPITTEGV